MLVSYVIPVYNMENYIVECIDSIFFQTMSEDNYIEIIIVNDGSTDKSMEKIQCGIKDKFNKSNFKSVTGYKILDLKNNTGAGNALFEGFNIADGDYICFLSADDMLVDRFKTQNQLNHMIKYQSDLSYCNLCMVGDFNKMDIIKSSFIFNFDYFNKFILSNNYLIYIMLNLKNPINSSTFMIKRQAINNYGSWDNMLKANCDGDILFKYSLSGAKITEADCENPAIYYRTHDNQVSNNSSLMMESISHNRMKYKNWVLSHSNYPMWLKLLVWLTVKGGLK